MSKWNYLGEPLRWWGSAGGRGRKTLTGRRMHPSVRDKKSLEGVGRAQRPARRDDWPDSQPAAAQIGNEPLESHNDATVEWSDTTNSRASIHLIPLGLNWITYFQFVTSLHVIR